MRMSVIIATKDRAAYVDRALASLAAQIGAPSFEAIVVDNASSDGTRAVVERHAASAPFAIRYVYEAEPNRGKARNRGIEIAQGFLVVFCDDDVQVPPGFLAAHEAAHDTTGLVVNGPIINVSSYDAKPKPGASNYSRAFLCTCNVSVPKHSLEAVGAFDEAFHLYGWEDTELGVRLREAGMRWRFAWDAYLWHIKPEADNTLEVETRKAMERARMARHFLEKSSSPRVRAAVGAYPANLLRAKLLYSDPVLAVFAGLATSDATPSFLRGFARSQFLDGMYTRELDRALKK
jgi:glycosyltransferase involved in cell wall biosynthesis